MGPNVAANKYDDDFSQESKVVSTVGFTITRSSGDNTECTAHCFSNGTWDVTFPHHLPSLPFRGALTKSDSFPAKNREMRYRLSGKAVVDRETVRLHYSRADAPIITKACASHAKSVMSILSLADEVSREGTAAWTLQDWRPFHLTIQQFSPSYGPDPLCVKIAHHPTHRYVVSINKPVGVPFSFFASLLRTTGSVMDVLRWAEASFRVTKAMKDRMVEDDTRNFLVVEAMALGHLRFVLKNPVPKLMQKRWDIFVDIFYWLDAQNKLQLRVQEGGEWLQHRVDANNVVSLSPQRPTVPEGDDFDTNWRLAQRHVGAVFLLHCAKHYADFHKIPNKASLTDPSRRHVTLQQCNEVETFMFYIKQKDDYCLDLSKPSAQSDARRILSESDLPFVASFFRRYIASPPYAHVGMRYMMFILISPEVAKSFVALLKINHKKQIRILFESQYPIFYAEKRNQVQSQFLQVLFEVPKYPSHRFLLKFQLVANKAMFFRVVGSDMEKLDAVQGKLLPETTTGDAVETFLEVLRTQASTQPQKPTNRH
eukprot:Rmarinus@m.20106